MIAMPDMEGVASSPPLASPSNGSNGVALNPFSAQIDPAILVEHLVAILQVTLAASRQDLERPGSLLHPGSQYADTLSRCVRFANETQVALYVQKDLVSSPDDGTETLVVGAGTILSPQDMIWADIVKTTTIH